DLWLPLDSGIAGVTRVASARKPSAAVAPTTAPTTPTASKPEPRKPEPTKTAPTKLAPTKSALSKTDPAKAAPSKSEPVSEATMSDAPVAAGSATPELDSNARPTDDGYDYLFGETMYRNVSEAAVREPEPDQVDEPEE